MRNIIQEGELRRWTSHSMKSRPWHTTAYFVVLKNKNGKIEIYDRGKISGEWPQEYLEVFSENVVII